MKNNKRTFSHSMVVAAISVLVGIIATYFSYTHNVILAYGDAQAHINIAKKVTSSLTPGLTQIGGVWLPLQHILTFPFVWNDFLWKTGLGGSIISIIAFVWSSVILYRLTYYFTRNNSLSYLAPLIFITNPNILYFVTIPMSDMLIIPFATASIYYLLRWIYEDSTPYLVLVALFGLGASLIRYDGWALVVIELLIIVAVTAYKKRSLSVVQGSAIVFMQPAFFGIFLWLLWNRIIFNDILFSFKGEYSSYKLSMELYKDGYLPTYQNIIMSLGYYLANAMLVLGVFVFALGIIAVIYFIASNIKRGKSAKTLFALLLFIPLGFYTISLYTGNASMVVPLFANSTYIDMISNSRYGLHMVLPIAFFITYLFWKVNKKIKAMILIVLISQTIYFVVSGDIITLKEVTTGISVQKRSNIIDSAPIQQWVTNNYDQGLVLMDDFHPSLSLIKLGIPMKNFIGIWNKPYWEVSLQNPTKYAHWIILRKDKTDAVWNSLKDKPFLTDNYVNVFNSANYWVYKKRNSNEIFVKKNDVVVKKNNVFVRKEGVRLIEADKQFTFYGINIYDLPIRPKEEIDELLTTAARNNIHVIRLWAFNKNGHLSPTEFNQLDYIVDEADKHNIRLIVVFGNQWSEYGGINTYSKKPSQNEKAFYTDKEITLAFKQYIKKIVTRKNTLSGIEYRNDPSIMAWELLNEPRYPGDKHSYFVSEWVEDVGHFVLNLDDNHLLSIGLEGFISNNAKNESIPYYNNYGSDFESICKLSVIDICSAHVYPKYLLQDPTKAESQLDAIVGKWQKISHKYNKPFYIGETSFDLSSVDINDANTQRVDFVTKVSEVSHRKNISGALLWNVSMISDSNYEINIYDSSDKEILKKWGEKTPSP